MVAVLQRSDARADPRDKEEQLHIPLVRGVPFPPLALPGKGGPLERQPAWVYVHSLRESSRSTMQSNLRSILHLMFPGQPIREEDIYYFPWEALRHEQTSVMLAELQDRYACTSANALISALRGVLKAAWLLKLMGIQEYMRAVSIKGIRRESAGPRGRQAEEGVPGVLSSRRLAEDERGGTGTAGDQEEGRRVWRKRQRPIPPAIISRLEGDLS